MPRRRGRAEAAEVDRDELAAAVGGGPVGAVAARRARRGGVGGAGSSAGWAAASVLSPWPTSSSGSPCASIGPRSRSTVFGAHALAVAVAQPRLGGGREREQVAPSGPAQALDLKVAGADRKHDGGQRGVKVGADPGGDAGALAGVGVERLQAGERAGVELADVLVDGVDVPRRRRFRGG